MKQFSEFLTNSVKSGTALELSKILCQITALPYFYQPAPEISISQFSFLVRRVPLTFSLSLKSNQLTNHLSTSKSGSHLGSPHLLALTPTGPIDSPNTHTHGHAHTWCTKICCCICHSPHGQYLLSFSTLTQIRDL